MFDKLMFAWLDANQKVHRVVSAVIFIGAGLLGGLVIGDGPVDVIAVQLVAFVAYIAGTVRGARQVQDILEEEL